MLDNLHGAVGFGEWRLENGEWKFPRDLRATSEASVLRFLLYHEGTKHHEDS